ncbi:hypothetical protein [Oricola sp.]|uniref:hypothetical protein n=1 Tax=Oricola sp. TaxID=1979950 RepID=UPI003BADBE1D
MWASTLYLFVFEISPMNSTATATALSLLFSVMSAAFAQADRCACTLPLSENDTAAVGVIAAADGSVYTQSMDGFSLAVDGEPVFLGSRIITGVDGMARVRLERSANIGPARCGVDLAPNSELVLFSMDNSICVSVDGALSVRQTRSQPVGSEADVDSYGAPTLAGLLSGGSGAGAGTAGGAGAAAAGGAAAGGIAIGGVTIGTTAAVVGGALAAAVVGAVVVNEVSGGGTPVSGQ